MLNALDKTQKGILAAFCGFASFALADACAKWLGMRYEAASVVFWVNALSCMIGLMCAPLLGGLRRTLRTKKLIFHLGRGVCGVCAGLLVVLSLAGGLPLSTFYTILFLMPFLATMAAIPIYGEHVSLRRWGIIALGFCGVLVAFHGGLSGVTKEVTYVFYALFFIVCLQLLTRPLDDRETVLSLSFYPAAVSVTVLSFFVFPDADVPQWRDIPVFVLDAVLVILGLSGIAYGFRVAPYALITPIQYVQMVVALIVGYTVFGDVPDLPMMLGAGIIILSGVLLVSSHKTGVPEPVQDHLP